MGAKLIISEIAHLSKTAYAISNKIIISRTLTDLICEEFSGFCIILQKFNWFSGKDKKTNRLIQLLTSVSQEKTLGKRKDETLWLGAKCNFYLLCT